MSTAAANLLHATTVFEHIARRGATMGLERLASLTDNAAESVADLWPSMHAVMRAEATALRGVDELGARGRVVAHAREGHAALERAVAEGVPVGGFSRGGGARSASAGRPAAAAGPAAGSGARAGAMDWERDLQDQIDAYLRGSGGSGGSGVAGAADTARRVFGDGSAWLRGASLDALAQVRARHGWR